MLRSGSIEHFYGGLTALIRSSYLCGLRKRSWKRKRPKQPNYQNSSEADTDAIECDTREFGCPCFAD